ncbi:hypothetical protein GCK72_015260 [Caenorhabditis remanei]|uniref:Uncharacterized protein n=1 Tax=Caenorhabditis remanei TaxID=31234 RepID=A0A6A5GTK8_CAERE|nr:hypothetical protein GCK72_015260 [Caenorhabditis remanei]KAF1758800.1 hypothetical protein GCK72_015260 [Caenorhabditis remanei]
MTISIESCHLWAIERNVFHAIMMESAREKTMTMKRYLKWSNRFCGYPEEVLLRIAEFCTEMRYEAREELVVKPQKFVQVKKLKWMRGTGYWNSDESNRINKDIWILEGRQQFLKTDFSSEFDSLSILLGLVAGLQSQS